LDGRSTGHNSMIVAGVCVGFAVGR
jgi:hypothetical protein